MAANLRLKIVRAWLFGRAFFLFRQIL